MTCTTLSRRSRLSLGLTALALLVLIPGCNYVVLLGYLIGGPPQLEPLFEKETGKSFTDKDVRVAVVCYAPDELKYQFDNIDHVLSKSISMHLAQKGKVDVVRPDKVRTWLEENRDWDTPVEVGAAFDVRYVVYIDLADFSLYERDSVNLFRGRCEAIVSVYEMKADGTGRPIFSRDLNSAYPTQVPRSASEVSYDTFRMEYFIRLSDEIGRMFYPSFNGDDIGYAT
ncbi:MAG: hypothetical protein KDA91_07920 [Planctomycetaceae bacterium]|nr:hypothetical protein [Planctomycetaceae bacterium]